MAAIAQRDQEKRLVEVNRLKLVETLELNLAKHIKEYDEAMAGYKMILLSKIDEAFEDAKKQLDSRYEKTKVKVASFTDADIAKQRDHFTIIDDITVEMRVPRSYAKEYEAAIDIAKWDVNETLKLSHAEFTCFVRDQWDWKSDFEAISSTYKMG